MPIDDNTERSESGGEGAATTKSRLNQERVTQLMPRINEFVGLEINDPSRQGKALALMSDIEFSRKQLGIECVTIGEGESRTLVFRTPLERTGHELMDLTGLPHPLTGSISEPWDIGTLNTTYREYLYLNRNGFFKLVFVVDQAGEINLNSPAFTGPNHGNLPNTVDESRESAERMRQIVQHEAVRTEKALKDVLHSGQLPPNPPPELMGYPPRRYADIDNLYGPDTAYNRDVWEIAKQLRPDAPFLLPIGLREQDTTFDAKTGLSGFRGGLIASVRVTKPDFVSQAIRASTISRSRK